MAGTIADVDDVAQYATSKGVPTPERLMFSAVPRPWGDRLGEPRPDSPDRGATA